MNKERELLKKILATGWLNNTISCEVEELLTQKREPLREDLREGISLRDHFAGLAMQGLLVSMKFKSADLCLMAYTFADVMLAEREKNDH